MGFSQIIFQKLYQEKKNHIKYRYRYLVPVSYLVKTITGTGNAHRNTLHVYFSSLLFASRAANIRTNPSPNIIRREISSSAGFPLAGA
jgi:hypothetical protein